MYTFYSMEHEDKIEGVTKYNDGVSIRLFSKGLRIQQIKSKNVYTLGGFLNFKEKTNLNLNKSQIIPFSKVNKILQKYEIQLLNKFWEDTTTSTIEELQAFSISFYRNIYRGRSFHPNSRIEEYYHFFKETLYPITNANNQLGIIQLGNFLESNSQFILAPIIGFVDLNNLEDKIELHELSEEYGIKMVIPSFETLLLYLEWIYNRKFFQI